MSSFVSQHESDPYSRFTTGVAGELQTTQSGAVSASDSEKMRKTLNELTASFALTNKILAATYGSGISDRRSGQTFYIDVGLSLPDVAAVSADYLDASVLVNTTRISEMVSPSQGSCDIKFNIGVDSFSVHRYVEPTDPLKVFPITVVCDKLQSSSGSRYLTVLSGTSGTALSGTAQSVFFGEIPSSLEFRIGFMSPIPTDSNGVLNRTVFPLSFGSLWKDTAEGKKAPRVFGTDDLLWETSHIYAMSLRLYVIPTITPRIHVQSS
jgi:hypothetical protein